VNWKFQFSKVGFSLIILKTNFRNTVILGIKGIAGIISKVDLFSKNLIFDSRFLDFKTSYFFLLRTLKIMFVGNLESNHQVAWTFLSRTYKRKIQTKARMHHTAIFKNHFISIQILHYITEFEILIFTHNKIILPVKICVRV
jgi:hypothetical protein